MGAQHDYQKLGDYQAKNLVIHNMEQSLVEFSQGKYQERLDFCYI